MPATALLALLVAGVVVLTPIADRIGVPQPVLVTLYGVGIGALPWISEPQLPPDLILPLVLPPLLFAATQNTSIRELREAKRPILTLAVGLTLATAALVTVVALGAGNVGGGGGGGGHGHNQPHPNPMTPRGARG